MTKTAKTAAEKIGAGDRVIRRTESGGRTSPLVGEVVGMFPNGKLRVRWDGTYPRFRGGMQTVHSTVKPGALRLATDENIAASQRRIDLRRERAYAETVERYDRLADDAEARGQDGARERLLADRYREYLRQVREGLGKGDPEGTAATPPRARGEGR